MLLRVSPDISSLEVCAETEEQRGILGAAAGREEPVVVHEFADPVLMTDNSRIADLDPGQRDALHALYESYPRTVEYDGVSLSWSPQQYPRVWGPSIDTIFIAREIKRLVRDARRIAEVGTGSGFLTKFALQHGLRVERAVASDINFHALSCAKASIDEIDHTANVSLVLPDPDDPTIGFGGVYDLIFSNPPYIPRPGAGNDNPYEGLGLIHKMAVQGPAMLSREGRMLLNISTLSGPLPEQWLRENGWSVSEVGRLRVPLKVNAITSGLTPESRAWLSYLEGRGLVPAPSAGYRYWHDLRLLECAPPQARA